MSIRKTLGTIATGLFNADQKELRKTILRATSALASVYGEAQAELFQNAAIPVKYIVVPYLT